MKKLIVALGVSVLSIIGIAAASADPVVTVCVNADVNINGTTLPPEVPQGCQSVEAPAAP